MLFLSGAGDGAVGVGVGVGRWREHCDFAGGLDASAPQRTLRGQSCSSE